MRRQSLFLAVGFSIIFLINGCASINSLENTRREFPDRVKSSVFQYPQERVFEAAKEACRDLKLSVYLEDKDKGKIYAKSSLRWLIILLSWGSMGFAEKAEIYLTTLDSASTKAEVVVQKSFLFDIGYADWRQRILDSMAGHLK